MNARMRMLHQIRSQLGRGEHAPVPPPPPVPLLVPVDRPLAERIELFGERLRAAGGRLHVPADDAARDEVLRTLLADCRTCAISDAPGLGALVTALAPHLTVLPPERPRAELLQADVGLSHAQWGIADTGTLALDGGAERHRLCSLLPPRHIALLPRSRLLCGLGELLKTVGRPLPGCLTLITGPSRTADIELQLVVGVHGPRELDVLLV